MSVQVLKYPVCLPFFRYQYSKFNFRYFKASNNYFLNNMMEDSDLAEALSTKTAQYFNQDYIPILENEPLDMGFTSTS